MSILEQVSFTSGEISPSLYARTDLARYQSGVKKLLNFIPMQYGGVRNRAGFKAIPCAFDQYNSPFTTATPLMIPFSRSETDNMVIMINGLIIRFAKNGSLVTYSKKTITGITKANPAVVTSASHGYSNNDPVLISGVIGTSQVNNREFIALNVTANTFELAILDKDIGFSYVDSTGYDAYLQGGGAYKVYQITSPYGIGDLSEIDYAQTVDLVVLTHKNYPVKALRYFSDTNWTILDYDLNKGAFQEENTTENTIVYDAGSLRSSPSGVFSSANVGQLVKLQTDDFGVPWEAGVVVAANTVRRAGDNFYKTSLGGTTGTLRPSHSIGDYSDGAVVWRYIHNGIGIVKITAFANAKEVAASVIDYVPEGCYRINYGLTSASIVITNGGSGGTNGNFPLGIVGGGYVTQAVGNFDVVGGIVTTITITGGGTFYLENPTLDFSASAGLTGVLTTITLINLLGTGNPTTPSKRWSLGAFGGDQGYPKSVNFYQERLILGGTTVQPETVFTSVVGSYNDFSTSSPLKDDDALVFTIAGRKLNKIKFIEGVQDLLCFTSSGENLIAGGQDGVLTPSTLSARPQSNYGCAQVKPVLVNSNVIFVHQNGSTLFDIGFNASAETKSGLIADDITLLANHLFLGRTIKKLAYQQTPDSVLWAVRDDGVLLSCTYLKEQQVVAWAQHTTDGLFKDICVIQENARDKLYAIIERDGVGTLEVMETRDITTIYGAFFVDGGYSYNGVNTTSKTMTLTGGTLWDDSETLTLTASASTFSSDDIGQYVFLYHDDGVVRLVITAYTSPTVISVISDRTVVAGLRSIAVTNWSSALLEVGGLWSLNGKTVSVLANGNVEPQQVVANGKATLQSASDRFCIGLPYVSDLETLKINVLGSRDGTTQTKQKMINKVSLICQDTRGLYAGADDSHLREYRPPKRSTYDDPLELQSGLFEQSIASAYDKAGNILIRQSDPLPVTILSIIPEITVGGA